MKGNNEFLIVPYCVIVDSKKCYVCSTHIQESVCVFNINIEYLFIQNIFLHQMKKRRGENDYDKKNMKTASDILAGIIPELTPIFFINMHLSCVLLLVRT